MNFITKISTILLALVLGLATLAQAQEFERLDIFTPEHHGQWDLFDLVDFAANDINNYWARVFAEANVTYYPPSVVQPYTAEYPVYTECGESIPNNAFYCSLDHSISYDADLFAYMLNEVGDFAVVSILAHEWGHALQGQLGLFGTMLTIDSELQADCLTGAYTSHVVEDGLADPGDVEEGAYTFFLLGDPEGTPHDHPDAHGSPEMRMNAFLTGLERGVAYCFEQQLRVQSMFIGIIEEPVLAPGRAPEPIQLNVASPRPGELSITVLGYGVESVELTLLDASGQVVFEDRTDGNSLHFHGLNRDGQRLANGVYFYVVTIYKSNGDVERSEVKQLMILN